VGVFVMRSSTRTPMYASCRLSTTGGRPSIQALAFSPAINPCAAASSYPDVPLTCPAVYKPPMARTRRVTSICDVSSDEYSTA
jgi:hypothetical protein